MTAARTPPTQASLSPLFRGVAVEEGGGCLAEWLIRVTSPHYMNICKITRLKCCNQSNFNESAKTN